MATYNSCYFEGTVWQPNVRTLTDGRSVWSGKLSVYKRKNGDKYEYIPVMLRAYGETAENLKRQVKERDKMYVNASYRQEEYNGKYYHFFVVDSWGNPQPEPVTNNSPYAQSYKPATSAQPAPVQQQITPADDELPF